MTEIMLTLAREQRVLLRPTDDQPGNNVNNPHWSLALSYIVRYTQETAGLGNPRFEVADCRPLFELTGDLPMPSEIRFAVIRRMFQSHGWQLVRIRSSHHIFSKSGRGSFSVPVHHDRVKAEYVKKIQKLFAEENGYKG